MQEGSADPRGRPGLEKPLCGGFVGHTGIISPPGDPVGRGPGTGRHGSGITRRGGDLSGRSDRSGATTSGCAVLRPPPCTDPSPGPYVCRAAGAAREAFAGAGGRLAGDRHGARTGVCPGAPSGGDGALPGTGRAHVPQHGPGGRGRCAQGAVRPLGRRTWRSGTCRKPPSPARALTFAHGLSLSRPTSPCGFRPRSPERTCRSGRMFPTSTFAGRCPGHTFVPRAPGAAR